MKQKRKFSTYLCCLVMSIFGVVLSIIGPLLSGISNSYSLNLSQTGLLFSINFLGFISFIFIGGILAERFGKKFILTYALLGMSITLFVFGFSRNVILAFIAIFFIGGFGSVIESVGSSLVADLNETDTDYYINLSQVFLCVGATMGPLMAFVFILSGNSWRLLYYLTSAVFLIMFVVMINIRMPDNRITEKIDIKEFKAAFADRKFVLVLVGLILYTGTEVGVWGWMSTFMGDELKLSLSVSAVLVSVFWISMTVGRIVCGRLIKYFKIKHILIVLSLFSGIVILLSGFVRGSILPWLIVGVTGFAFSSIYPFLLSLGSTRKSSATAFTIMVGSGGIGTVIIPFLMGIIGDSMGTNIAMMSPSILMFIIAGLFMI